MLLNPILSTALAFLAATLVNAQSPSLSLIPETTTTDLTGPTEIPRNCMLQCLTAAATEFLCDPNDDICLCATPGLAETAVICANSRCSDDEANAMIDAFQQGCGELIDTGIASISGTPANPRPTQPNNDGNGGSPNTDNQTGSGQDSGASFNTPSSFGASAVLALGLSTLGALLGGALML